MHVLACVMYENVIRRLVETVGTIEMVKTVKTVETVETEGY